MIDSAKFFVVRGEFHLERLYASARHEIKYVTF